MEPQWPAFQREMFFPIYAKYFKGNSYLAQISDSQIPFFNVTFEPGCRNNWHTHHATKGGGQMLVGVAGRGWYQEEGKPVQEIYYLWENAKNIRSHFYYVWKNA